MTRRCGHGNCRHLARRGRLYCRPHLKTRLQRSDSPLAVLTLDLYTKHFREQMLLPTKSSIFSMPSEERVAWNRAEPHLL